MEKGPKRGSAATEQGSLSDLVYRAVLEAIQAGDLKPGQRVSEARIAARLNISRTPAREALQRLQFDGLLQLAPRRGLIVRMIDQQTLAEVFAAREVLDRSLAELAAANGSGPELAMILSHAESEVDVVSDADAMFAHNVVFHDLIRRAAHNQFLERFSRGLQELVAADLRGSTMVLSGRPAAVVREHRDLAKAIARRDVEGAGAAAAAHVRSAHRARLLAGKRSPVQPDLRPLSSRRKKP